MIVGLANGSGILGWMNDVILETSSAYISDDRY